MKFIFAKVLKKMIHIVMLIEASRRKCLQICKKKTTKTTTLVSMDDLPP